MLRLDSIGGEVALEVFNQAHGARFYAVVLRQPLPDGRLAPEVTPLWRLIPRF
jgi:hypothetical protein